MPADPSLVEGDLREVVRGIIADVLMVPVERVNPGTALVAELGAESIDFLDLVFRLEETLGKKIKAARWGEFVRERLGESDLRFAITTDIVCEFAAGELKG